MKDRRESAKIKKRGLSCYYPLPMCGWGYTPSHNIYYLLIIISKFYLNIF